MSILMLKMSMKSQKHVHTLLSLKKFCLKEFLDTSMPQIGSTDRQLN